MNPNQSGFRPCDSTINQLLSITHSIFTAFDCNPTLEVRSVYLDISKAFDRVWHEGLIFKLRQCGVSGDLLSLLKNFLADRKQRTVLNGQSSNWGDICAGVPQGSILGPLFFLIYINDLTENIKCKVKLFADDTSLFTIVEDADSAACDLNHDLEQIKLWAYKWRMSFNPDPRKQAVELIFSTKNARIDHPPLVFNNIPVINVDQHKHLGIILDRKLSFSAHIMAAISKARKGIGMLRFLSNYLSRNTLNNLYKLYVRPHLDYGDVIYHIPQKYDNVTCSKNYMMEKLESVQYSAALTVTGAWKGTSREKLYNELGWETLDLRRRSRRLVLFYKFINNLTPDYTREPVPPLHVTNHNLRYNPSVGQIRARTEKFKSSFYPHCLMEWNSLDPETRVSPSVNNFKKLLTSKIRPSGKSVFGIYDRKGIAYLTQLRVGLSQLNFHKFQHNFKDTVDALCPISDCIEDTEHFLLYCDSFKEPRRDLLADVETVFQANNLNSFSSCNKTELLLY